MGNGESGMEYFPPLPGDVPSIEKGFSSCGNGEFLKTVEEIASGCGSPFDGEEAAIGKNDRIVRECCIRDNLSDTGGCQK